MTKHMLTVEKDAKAQTMCLHGSPESLRMLAKKLWAIAEKAESEGHYHEQLSSQTGVEPTLTTQLQGKSGQYTLVHKLGIFGHAD